MHAMDGRMMDGRELRVQLARYGRPDDPPRRSGRSSRRRRYIYFIFTSACCQFL